MPVCCRRPAVHVPAESKGHLLPWCRHEAQAGALQGAEGQRRRGDGQVDGAPRDGDPAKQVEHDVGVGRVGRQRGTDTLKGRRQGVLLQDGRDAVCAQGCEHKDEAADEAEALELADPQPARQAGDGEGGHHAGDAEAQQGRGARDQDVQHQQP